MRVLGIGDTCDLGALYLRLVQEGHEVRVSIANPLCHGILAGLVARTDDWHRELDWVRGGGRDGILLFENVAKERGALQDALRRDGYQVIGGSAYGDRLENDRAHAMEVLAGVGLSIAPVFPFSDRRAALTFLDRHPARYVLKFNGPDAAIYNYVGRLADGRDVRAYLAGLSAPEIDSASLILMEFVEGVEIGVGAYFDGEKFIEPACLDWEHKRFFPGDLGELTGEMGTVVTFERTRTFFARTLARIAPLLRASGHCGYVNLNTIVNESGIWPLEFTCRFGYPGFAILTPLQQVPWGELLAGMTRKSLLALEARSGFCVGIVLTMPPFPYPRPQVQEPLGLPVLFDGELTVEDRANLHYCELGLENGVLVTAGIYGWAMVVTGTGETVAAAQRRANALADRVLIPNVRYRRDIGQRLIAGEFARVEALGLLEPVPIGSL
jgi:phosphoribosylamine--glycine ligase